MLKTSARNCTLALYEIFGAAKFLYNEKSTLASPGPTMLLRPALPRRFAQVPGMPGLPGSDGEFVPGALSPKGEHCAAIAGVALGSVKQFVLIKPRVTPPGLLL